MVNMAVSFSAAVIMRRLLAAVEWSLVTGSHYPVATVGKCRSAPLSKSPPMGAADCQETSTLART